MAKKTLKEKGKERMIEANRQGMILCFSTMDASTSKNTSLKSINRKRIASRKSGIIWLKNEDIKKHHLNACREKNR